MAATRASSRLASRSVTQVPPRAQAASEFSIERAADGASSRLVPGSSGPRFPQQVRQSGPHSSLSSPAKGAAESISTPVPCGSASRRSPCTGSASNSSYYKTSPRSRGGLESDAIPTGRQPLPIPATRSVASSPAAAAPAPRPELGVLAQPHPTRARRGRPRTPSAAQCRGWRSNGQNERGDDSPAVPTEPPLPVIPSSLRAASIEAATGSRPRGDARAHCGLGRRHRAS